MTRFPARACLAAAAALVAAPARPADAEPAPSESPAKSGRVEGPAPTESPAKSGLAEGAPAAFERDVRPLLARYCRECHNAEKKKGNLNFAAFPDEASLLANRKVVRALWTKLHSREMPPENHRPRPSAAERDRLTDWAEGALSRLDSGGAPDPGRVVIRRLNRTEYRNTLRDLLGVDAPLPDFPTDDVGYGFDNIGDVLSLPPLLLEKYFTAAERALDLAIVVGAGPSNAPPPEVPAGHRRIFIASPGKDKRKAARDILAAFAARAFRRPAAAEELDRLVKLFDAADKRGEPFEAAMKAPLLAVLVSPHFLFRAELDRPGDDPKGVRAVGDYELADRLSYFLWSTMPDDELFELARRGTLHEPAVLEAQVRRMLAHPKARALAEDFAAQWLQIRRLESAAPDRRRFPDYDDALRDAMVREAVLFFEAILRDDRSVLQLLDADFTFVNEALARHYGLGGVTGPEMRRVRLTDPRRGGVLTMAAVLTATSTATRTSPVKRGKWVLESILGTPPPPPVPGADNLKEQPAGEAQLTLRRRMERHRADPACAACHERMDAIGFGLENYNAVGAWRDADDAGAAIDASGSLPQGGAYSGPVQLKVLLLSMKEDFVRCLVEKMMTYALGRGLEYYDAGAVRKVSRALAEKNYAFSTLALEIAKSYPFRHRRNRALESPKDDPAPPGGTAGTDAKGGK